MGGIFDLFIGIFVFCFVLFLYLHIYYHLKTSNDLEVFEIEGSSKDSLEEICDIRQPVLFDLPIANEKLIDVTSIKNIMNQ